MKKKSIITLFLISIIWVFGCNSNEETNQNDNAKDSTEVSSEHNVQTFFLVPSPEDVFGFANNNNLVFNKDLLNPTDNISKYDNDIKLQEFNFGVYAADLAYSASFTKNDETIQYLNTVRELSLKIGLAEVFNESLIYRIEHVSPKKDSLITLSNDTYFDIIRYLERNDRPSTLATMAAGGWIECMYLVVNLTPYSESDATIQKIADQKMIVTNLWHFLEQNKDIPSISSLMEDFRSIVDIYEELEVVVDEQTVPKTTDNENIIILGGGQKIKISEAQFNNLKKVIIKIRNKLTLNDVSL